MSSSSRVVRFLARRLALVACAASALAAGSAVAAAAADTARVIVGYRSGGSLAATAADAGRGPQHAAVLSQRLGLGLADGRPIGSRMQVVRAAGLSADELAARLAADPDIEFAVPSRRRRAHAVVPNDPYYPAGQIAVTPVVGQWYLRPPDSSMASSIDAVGAWAVTTGAPGVVVAVLDTGVRYDHPDLAGKLHPGYDFVSSTVASNDGDGRDGDAGDPGDWVAAGACGAGKPSESSSWHGTKVAGLIGAATDNAIGMASAGRNTMVLPVRVLGRCGGDDGDILAAMLWAAGLSSDPVPNPHPARVLNLSFGSTGGCSAGYRSVLAQLAAAGVTVVASAGNDVGLAVSTPANCPGVIAVAGVRHTGTKVGFSSLGPEIALAAPAGNCVNVSGPCLYPILTTTNAGSTLPGANGYSSGSDATLGTSFSAPLVAGTAALMLSVNPSLSGTQLKTALQSAARPFPNSGAGPSVAACHAPTASPQDECYCTTGTCGAGLLDAGAAVRAVVAAGLPVAVVAASTAKAVAGSTVALDGTASHAVAAGTTLVGYRWSLVGNSGSAEFTAATDGPKTQLFARSAGDVTVALTVTDSAGRQTSTTTTFAVEGSVGGSGGGGGALDAGALGGLAIAVAGLAIVRSRGRTTGARIG